MPPTSTNQLESGHASAAGQTLPRDAALVEEFLRGDEAAVTTIGGWLEEGVRGYRCRLTVPWEDVRQYLLLEALRQLRRRGYRGDAHLRTYLWRLARYRCSNLLRDEARYCVDPLDDDLAVSLEGGGSSPLDQALQRESASAAIRSMRDLSPACQHLCKMVLAGKSYREMSEELGVSQGALRVRMLRCRRLALQASESAGENRT